MRRGGKNAKTTAASVKKHKQMAEILNYRLAGETFREIAPQMHISTAYAHRLCCEALREIIREPAEELVTLQLERLDLALKGIMQRVSDGDDIAINTMLRIEDRRSR